MHCGASLSELQGALVLHRKCLGKRLGHMLVFVGECSVGMCSSSVHCTLLSDSNHLSGIWGETVGLKMGWNDGCS